MRIKIFMLVTAVVLLCCSGVATAAPKTYCEELKGTDTGQACQIQMSDPAYNINISLPSYYPDQKSLENYIAQTRDKFLSAATSSTPREAPYELNITSATYQSAIPPRGTQAVVLKVYQNAGGTHPTTTYKPSIGTRPIASQSPMTRCGRLTPIRCQSSSPLCKVN